MVFSSTPFLFYLLPLFLAAYYLTPWKNFVLLCASLIFYAWGEPVYILVLLASLILNHLLGKQMSGPDARRWLLLGIVVNLSVLGLLKYAGFFLSAFPELAQRAEGLRQPIGISFYTFQAVSFLIDLYRRDAPPPKRFVNTALYIAMFPQLIAGPIVRYKTMADQLTGRTHSVDQFASGAQIFILGLAQKVLLANTFAQIADAAFGAETGLSTQAAWLGLAAYSFQIFFDFAGYSNMAIGLGRMFGFELPQNFNFPYVSQSVTEFWRRWHITLSNWFRDYLYIPLGGNRAGAARTFANLWIVFLLCGLWHGAAIAFVFWGAYHGTFLVLERAFLSKWLQAVPRVFRHGYLLIVVALGWVPFRTEDMGEALGYYKTLFGFGPELTGAAISARGDVIIFAAAILVAFWPIWSGAAKATCAKLFGKREFAINPTVSFTMLQLALLALFIASAASLASGTYNPFIYFNF